MQDFNVAEALQTLQKAGWPLGVTEVENFYHEFTTMASLRMNDYAYDLRAIHELQDIVTMPWLDIAALLYWLEFTMEYKGYEVDVNRTEIGWGTRLRKGDTGGLHRRNRDSKVESMLATALSLAEEELGGKNE